jgi:group II intron reverse transcriptase/maturase
MRSPIDVLNSLSDKSKDPAYRFKRLYRNLYNPEFYLLAYKNIYANKGSMTPGADGTTLDGMSLARVKRIIESLKDQSYRPTPARREYIAKKDSDKKRPLGIPSGDDKLVQEVVRMILDSMYEPTFSEASHGFRPHRSCHTALIRVEKTFTGAKWFVEGDIKACFDSFEHHVLIDILRKRIDDEMFISLMWKFLKAGYMEQWHYHATYSGTPQGSGMSPVLANIYLHGLDAFVEKLKEGFDTGSPKSRTRNAEYKKLDSEIQRFRVKNAKSWDAMSESERKQAAHTLRQMKNRKRELSPYEVRDTGYKSLQYVRYADDFLIGVIGSKQDAEQLRTRLAEFLKGELKLTLSIEKTKITHTGQRARFLGYDITVSRSQEVMRTKAGARQRVFSGSVHLLVPHEKWAAKLQEYKAIRIRKDAQGKELWKAIHRGLLINRPDIEILRRYNAEVRGLYNYYSLARNAYTIGKFGGLMKHSMLRTFAAKYRTTVNKIRRKYEKGGSFKVKYPTREGDKEAVFYNSGFTHQSKPWIWQIDTLEPYKKYSKPNSLASRLRASTCELCGAVSSEIEIHQVKLLKDLKGKHEWEVIMKQNRRKTLAVCKTCHDEIHRTMKS